MKNGLFPELPKDLKALSDEEIKDLLDRSEKSAGLIDAEDAEFLGDLTAEEIIDQYKEGALAIMALREDIKARDDAVVTFKSELAQIRVELAAMRALLAERS